MIATHGDQLDRRQVSDEEIKERAAALNYSYFVTSAVDGQNVNEAFRAMGSMILKKSKKDESEMGSGRWAALRCRYSSSVEEAREKWRLLLLITDSTYFLLIRLFVGNQNGRIPAGWTITLR